MSIKYIPYQQIDKSKWDHCIRDSFNGLIYGYSWFLDIVCEHWDAIVEDDYACIMPLPYRTNWFFDRIYQPEFVQQLGIFSTGKLNAQKCTEFFQKIPSRFRVSTFNLNQFNNVSIEDKKNSVEIDEYKMDLILGYERIADSYSVLTRNRIDKANKNVLNLRHDISPLVFVKFYQRYNRKLDEFTAMRFTSLVSTLVKLKVGNIMGVFDHKGRMLAAAMFISYLNNASLLAQVVSPLGKKNDAFYKLIDSFLQNNSQKNVTLDFPDARSQGFGMFYQGFGCIHSKYVQMNINTLPTPIRYFIN